VSPEAGEVQIGYEQILAKRIMCRKARTTVRRWVNDSEPLPNQLRGWRCNAGTLRGLFWIHRCQRRHQRLILKQRCLPGHCRPEIPEPRNLHCGDIARFIVSEVIATNLRCRAARSIARRYVSRGRCYREGCRVGTYRCRRTVIGYESYHARCVRGDRVAGFDYGA
jgi:hypothetical protein